jgi:hypothetical protein
MPVPLKVVAAAVRGILVARAEHILVMVVVMAATAAMVTAAAAAPAAAVPELVVILVTAEMVCNRLMCAADIV